MSNTPSISKSISDFNRSTIEVINVFKTEVLKCVFELSSQITKLESVLKTPQLAQNILSQTEDYTNTTNTEDTPDESLATSNDQIPLNS